MDSTTIILNNEILYEHFGAASLNAIKVIETAKKFNTFDAHFITKQVGFSFRFVCDVIGYLSASTADNLTVSVDFTRYEHVLLKEFSKIIETFGYNNADYDHISATSETIIQRVSLLFNLHDCAFCNILFLGDHDLTSIAYALLRKKIYPTVNSIIYVVDIDEVVLKFIQEVSDNKNLNIVTLYSDFRYSFPNFLKGTADIIFTDPPYTPEGIKVFLKRAIEASKKNNFSIAYLCYKTAETSPKLGILVQKEILKMGLYIYSLHPNFNEYTAAEAIGYRSDLYSLMFTPQSYSLIKVEDCYNDEIYTHGNAAIESKKDYSSFLTALQLYLENMNLLNYILISATIKKTQADKVNIRYNSAHKFVSHKIAGKYSIPTDFIPLFHIDDPRNFASCRLLLLTGCEKFVVVVPVEKYGYFNANLITIILKIAYDNSVIKDSNGFRFVQFKTKKRFQTLSEQIFASMLLNPRATVKNSFVGAATKILNITKNEARTIFAKFTFGLRLESALMYECPMECINKFYAELGIAYN